MKRTTSPVVILICCFLRPVEGAALFDFHSGFWINLHLTLYHQAQPRNAEEATVPADPDWVAALAYYRTNVVSHDLLFDDMMVTVKENLEAQEQASDLTSTPQLAPTWTAVLQRASHYYRTNLWQKQDRANQQWTEYAKLLVSRYGDQLAKELSAAYQTPWPSEPIRVDVANYANWSGAFTTTSPVTRITISSVDPANQNDAALEVLFHEASHGISDKLEQAISAVP